MRNRLTIIVTLVLGINIHSLATPVPACSATALLQRIKKLNVLSRVLYIAAHPDDENNCLNAYFSNELLTDVAYLSITRGDGGQNLIGSEQQDGLSILRTQESLASHAIDGAKVFFTSARDFGFSKTAKETLQIWDKEKILSDMVWIIRQYRPDVIITRFHSKAPEAHGHHVASAILAEEAFEAAADPQRFKDQLKSTTVWQAKRLLWNVYDQFTPKGSGGVITNDGYIVVDAGKYNPLLGVSYGELAAQSRMLHRSQGMGTAIHRGNYAEYFKHVKGEKSNSKLFEGITTSWSRVNAGHISSQIKEILQKFDVTDPAAVTKDLVSLMKTLDAEPKSFWVQQKKQELQQIIRDVLGLHYQVNAASALLTPGEATDLNIEVINRSNIPVTWQHIQLGFANKDSTLNFSLSNCSTRELFVNAVIDKNIVYSQPYWLQGNATTGHFDIEGQSALNDAENKSAAQCVFSFQVFGYSLSFSTALQYRYVSPEVGEQQKNVAIAPPVLIDITDPVISFTAGQSKKISVQAKAVRENVSGFIRLQVPQGWQVSPKEQPFHIEKKEATQYKEFTLVAPSHQQIAAISARAICDNKEYYQGYRCISYQHIDDQYYFPPAKAKVTSMELEKKVSKIAYLKGASDYIDRCLAEAGFEVSIIRLDEIKADFLEQFDALVIGIRAYNSIPMLDNYKDVLLNYAQAGGNVVALYNTSFDLASKEVGLFPIQLSTNRITDEHSPVRFLQPDHPVLNQPNKITNKDFEGWIQERGSFFPTTWDAHYQAILSLQDSGEKPLDGSLLIASHGKGYFTYTSLSFFRQIPAGVPGAYRLLSNILSLGK